MLTIVPKMRSFRPKWHKNAWKFAVKIAQKYWVHDGKPISEIADGKTEES